MAETRGDEAEEEEELLLLLLLLGGGVEGRDMIVGEG